MKICPESTSWSPAIALRSVDLPQPEGPSRTTNSPSPTDKVEVLQNLMPAIGDAQVANVDFRHAIYPFTEPAVTPRMNQRPDSR